MARAKAKGIIINGPSISVGAGSYGGARTSISVPGVSRISATEAAALNMLSMKMHQEFIDKAFNILNKDVTIVEGSDPEKIDLDEVEP